MSSPSFLFLAVICTVLCPSSSQWQTEPIDNPVDVAASSANESEELRLCEDSKKECLALVSGIKQERDVFAAEKEALLRTVTHFEEERIDLLEKVKAYAAQVTQKAEELELESGKLHDCAATLEQLQGDLRTISEEVASGQESIVSCNAKEQQLLEIVEEKRRVDAVIAEAQATIQKLESDYEQCAAQLSASGSHVDAVLREKDEVERQLQTTAAVMESNKNSHETELLKVQNDLSQQMLELQASTSEMEADLDRAEKRAVSCSMSLTTCTEQIDTYLRKLEELQKATSDGGTVFTGTYTVMCSSGAVVNAFLLGIPRGVFVRVVPASVRSRFCELAYSVFLRLCWIVNAIIGRFYDWIGGDSIPRDQRDRFLITCCLALFASSVVSMAGVPARNRFRESDVKKGSPKPVGMSPASPSAFSTPPAVSRTPRSKKRSVSRKRTPKRVE